MTASKQKMSASVALLWLSIVVAGLVGWVMNLVAIVGHDFIAETGFGVIRVLGVIIPIIGAVLGYI